MIRKHSQYRNTQVIPGNTDATTKPERCETENSLWRASLLLKYLAQCRTCKDNVCIKEPFTACKMSRVINTHSLLLKRWCWIHKQAAPTPSEWITSLPCLTLAQRICFGIKSVLSLSYLICLIFMQTGTNTHTKWRVNAWGPSLNNTQLMLQCKERDTSRCQWRFGENCLSLPALRPPPCSPPPPGSSFRLCLTQSMSLGL